MQVLGVPLAMVDAALIQRLLSEKVAENRHLDFKALLYKTGVALKKEKTAEDLMLEVAKDVAALANTDGGVIVCGIQAKDGIAQGIVPVPPADIDSEMLWIDSVLKYKVAPTVLGVTMRRVDIAGSAVFLIGVPRSLARPHGVWEPAQFWARNNAGNYPMDVFEIRRQIMEAAEWERTAVQFRRERLRRIRAGEGLQTLPRNAPSLILHVTPLGGPRQQVDLPATAGNWKINFDPGDAGVTYTARPNVDGWLILTTSTSGARHVQVFRNGGVEVRLDLHGFVVGKTAMNGALVNGGMLTFELARWLKTISHWLTIAGVPGPFVVHVTIVEAFGMAISAMGIETPLHADYAVEVDELDMPDLMVMVPPSSVAVEFKPIFDALWQAASWERCPMYTPDGTPLHFSALDSVTWKA
jgi:hypothetical protein